MLPKDTINIQFPRGGAFQFEIWSPETVATEISTSRWKLDDELSLKWKLELYRENTGKVLQIFPEVRLGFLLSDSSDLSVLNGRIVPYVTEKGEFCPYVLIDEKEVDILLKVPGTTHIANIKEDGEIDVYSLPDKRVFTDHKVGGVGELYMNFADFEKVEEEMSGFTPIVIIPVRARTNGTQAEGSD